MLRYILYAKVLKAFSFHSSTSSLYRVVGNCIGGRKRAHGIMPSYYLERVNRTLRLHRKLGVPNHGTRVLELGTGWMHWEAITSRLFFDTESVMLDVWDNRQIDGLKNYVRQLGARAAELDATEEQRVRALGICSQIAQTQSFNELYTLLNMRYYVGRQGDMGCIGTTPFDYVVSAGVLEHVPANKASGVVGDFSNLLRPGGYSVHSINLRDHLYPYDKTVSPKQYLSYSDRVWNQSFSNEVQYINRIQVPQWRMTFQDAGLVLQEEERELVDIMPEHIDSTYMALDSKDLASGGIRFVHRKGN